MSINKSLSMLAGAIALAVSAGANAANTQTLILNVVDTANGNAFIFDTGVAASATDPGSYSVDLSSNTAFSAFLAGRTSSSDALVYGVVGYFGNSVATTSTTTPTVVAGQKSNGAAVNVSQFLDAAGNPAGGGTFLPSSTTAAAAQWAQVDVSFAGNIGGSDLAAVGTAEDFYAITTTNAAGSRNGATVAKLTSQWNLNATTNVLSYGSAAVPLPAPVVLLLSGLGLMGVVTRRRPLATA